MDRLLSDEELCGIVMGKVDYILPDNWGVSYRAVAQAQDAKALSIPKVEDGEIEIG